MRRLKRSKWTPWIVLGALILCFVLAFGWLAVTRHQRFNSTGYDLAIMEQILWNTLNGRFFASSIEVGNSFADHFRPFLIVILPLYASFQTPETLLIIQTLVLASAAIPLYLLAKFKLADQVIALGLVAVYLLYPAVGFVARFDFHIEVFAIPAFIAGFYAMERRRWIQASLWLLIPLLVKENMGLTVAMFGVYALVMVRCSPQDRKSAARWGVTWLVVGLTTFLLTTFWLLPIVRGGTLDAFARYSWLGASPADMLANLLTNPGLVVSQLTSPISLSYLWRLLLPVGFIALLGLPELLPAVPGILTNLLAQHFCQPTIYCQYTVPVTPFIFVATVYGLFRLKRHSNNIAVWRGLTLLLVILTLFSFWVDNPFTDNSLLPPALTRIENAAVVVDALQAVPDDASVVTTNDYAPHLARREALFIIGIPTQREAPSNPDILFLNLYDQQFILCDELHEYASKLDIDAYGVTFRTGGLIVVQREEGSNEQFRDFVLNWNNCAG